MTRISQQERRGVLEFRGQLVIVQAVLFLLIIESHQLDIFCAFDDTFQPAYEIPLILLTDTMIMLEVEDQQDNLIRFFQSSIGCNRSIGLFLLR